MTRAANVLALRHRLAVLSRLACGEFDRQLSGAIDATVAALDALDQEEDSLERPGGMTMKSSTAQFGGWRLDGERLCLVFTDEEAWYEIDLERCETSAEILDWLCQVAAKSWATDEVLAGLVRAVNHYLKPQANFCSFGREQGPVDVRKVLR